MLPYARAALAAVAGARLTVEEMTGLLRGRVTVGMVAAIARTDSQLGGDAQQGA